jgi:hypothetical protein
MRGRRSLLSRRIALLCSVGSATMVLLWLTAQVAAGIAHGDLELSARLASVVSMYVAAGGFTVAVVSRVVAAWHGSGSTSGAHGQTDKLRALADELAISTRNQLDEEGTHPAGA